MRPIMTSVSLRTLTVLGLTLLAGCSLFESKQSRAMRRLPEYRAGYDDGVENCQALEERPLLEILRFRSGRSSRRCTQDDKMEGYACSP